MTLKPVEVKDYCAIIMSVWRVFMKKTIYDIAKELKVAPSTVSKALNNSTGISEKTRKKIQAYADQVRYYPNANASKLKTKKTYSIGVIYSDVSNVGLEHSFFSSILQSFKSFVECEGYEITFVITNLANRKISYLDYQKVLYEALLQMGQKYEAIDVLKTYCDQDLYFLEKLFDNYLAEKDFEQCHELLKKETKLKTHYHNKRTYLKLWLKYYQAKGEKNAFKKTLLKLLIIDPDYKFFSIHKDTLNEQEKTSLYAYYAKNVSNYNAFKILLEEAMYDYAYHYIMHAPYLLEKHYKAFPLKYKKRLDDLYENYLLDRVEGAYERKAYRRFVHQLYRYKNLSDNNIDDFVDKIKTQFKHRPALLDELDKN